MTFLWLLRLAMWKCLAKRDSHAEQKRALALANGGQLDLSASSHAFPMSQI